MADTLLERIKQALGKPLSGQRPQDRMVEATVNTVTTTFDYRGDGPRNSRTVGMTTTTFTWDINAGLPVVLEPWQAAGHGR